METCNECPIANQRCQCNYNEQREQPAELAEKPHKRNGADDYHRNVADLWERHVIKEAHCASSLSLCSTIATNARIIAALCSPCNSASLMRVIASSRLSASPLSFDVISLLFTLSFLGD